MTKLPRGLLLNILGFMLLGSLISPVQAQTAAAQCTMGTSTWAANPLAAQTGTFSVNFDATPQANGIDAQVAMSQGVPSGYTDLAAIVRFNPDGTIDARKGSDYAADYSQPYSAG